MKKTFVLAVLILYSLSVFAQIVNVEKRRKKKQGFQANIALDLNLKENGKLFFNLKNSIDLQYARKAHTVIFFNNIQLLNIDKGSFINNGFQHLRYNYTIKDSSFLSLEAFGQYQYNEQKLLKTRVIAGGGPRFALFENKKSSFYIASLAMFEYELLSDSLQTETRFFRGDFYMNFHLNINQLVSFSNIVYYQPVFTHFTDFRVSGEAGLFFNINRYIGYKVSFAIDYDNHPPENVQNTFWYLSNKLVFKF